MGQTDSIEAAWRAALREAQREGLADYPAAAHAWATAVLAYWGYSEPQRPDILSGRRSPERQRVMQVAWDRGRRAGLSARPASRSWHLAGRAADVEQHVAGYPAYVYLLTTYTGARDGRDFGDPGHVDWPTSEQPPSIWA